MKTALPKRSYVWKAIYCDRIGSGCFDRPRQRPGPAYAADARDACYSYGLTVGSAPYDRCVGREIEARRYSQQAAYPAPAVYAPAPTTTVYTPAPAATVYTQGPVTYAPAAPTPPAGVQAFRDEFGFRYDGQGNRIDAQGNIISPQSTRP